MHNSERSGRRRSRGGRGVGRNVVNEEVEQGKDGTRDSPVRRPPLNCRASSPAGSLLPLGSTTGVFFKSRLQFRFAIFLPLLVPFSYLFILSVGFSLSETAVTKNRIIQYLSGGFKADNGFRFAYTCWLYKHSHGLLYCAVAAAAACSSCLIREQQSAVSFSPCPRHFKTN